jgi:hypothetical protein
MVKYMLKNVKIFTFKATYILWEIYFVSIACCVAISQIIMPSAMVLVLLESLQWIEVHQGCLVMFRPMVQELLNIE